MVKLEFTAEEQHQLHYERYHHPHPRVQRKMEALWLKSQGVAHRQISRLTGISSTTLTSYLGEWDRGAENGEFSAPSERVSDAPGDPGSAFSPAPAGQCQAGDGDHRNPDRGVP